MNRLRHILQHRYLFKVLAIISLILALLYNNFYQKKSIYQPDETYFKGVVYKKKITNDKEIYYIKGKEKLVINYYDTTEVNISLGDEIEVIGSLKTPSNNTVPNLFNYKKYLYNNDIFYTVTAKSIKKTANNTNIMYAIKEKLNNHIDKIYKSNEYIKIFVLGDTSSLDEEVLSSYRENGISHLFSISGMHISLFASLLLYVLKRISYNNYYNYGMVIIFLIFYSLLVGSSASVLRSLIMYILFSLNKVFNLKVKSIDIMCLVLIIMLLYRPTYIYDISFQYSYLISFSLVLYSYKLKEIKNKTLKSLYISLISFLISFPICIYNFYQVNVLSIILNIFLIPLVSVIIFPLSLLSFIIPIFSYLLSIFTKILQTISLVISDYQLGIISFPKPSIYMIIIYYIFILLFLHNKKYFYIFIVMIFNKLLIYIDPTIKIIHLDVGQGDSTFIKFPHNQGNVLIDTGGLVNSSYSITTNKTIPYLQSRGINKIDYLILTHGDYDHIGEGVNLVNNFKVEKVIFNNDEYNDLELEIIEVLETKNIPYYRNIKELNIDNNKLYFLNNNLYGNENDNSNVIYTEVNGIKLLLMGDAGIDVEEDILEKYNLNDIDILKVGHHGSKTSSGEEFIDEIKPKYSIISVGKNNRYGHPNDIVLDNLEDSIIYRTDIDGSIIFTIKNNKLEVKTCTP